MDHGQYSETEIEQFFHVLNSVVAEIEPQYIAVYNTVLKYMKNFLTIGGNSDKSKIELIELLITTDLEEIAILNKGRLVMP